MLKSKKPYMFLKEHRISGKDDYGTNALTISTQGWPLIGPTPNQVP